MKKGTLIKVFSLTLALAVSLSFGGCGKEKPKKEVKEKPIVVEEEIVEEEEEAVVYEHENVLSGLDTLTDNAVGKRPVAVMVNNVEPALPQHGVEDADLIFEIPVEGDLTRLMALYGDYTKVPKVVSVRSCRYYFPVFAKGFDAFYVNWGMDETIRGYVEGLGIDQFDGMSFGHGLFGRDQDRKNAGYSLEHTAYFDGTAFASVLEDGYRLDLADDHKGTAFKFCEPEESITPSGDSCIQADVNFGGARCTLSYDENIKEYKKDINGHAHIDGNSGNQLSFKNAFIIETSISLREDGYHKHVEWQGGEGSTAYYLTDGTVQKVHWKKDGGVEGGRLIFFDDSGEEITINRGKTYIAITYPERTSIISAQTSEETTE